MKNIPKREIPGGTEYIIYHRDVLALLIKKKRRPTNRQRRDRAKRLKEAPTKNSLG
jgi:hypothetical protein